MASVSRASQASRQMPAQRSAAAVGSMSNTLQRPLPVCPKAVLIGRAYLWGLAANGQAGVENVLDILRGGIDSALLGMGHSSIHDLTRDDVLVPDGFTRTLGVPR